MTKLLRVCLLALPLLACSATADAAWKIEAGSNNYLNIYNTNNCKGFCCGAHAGPWYEYFPYEAYFQTPAPQGFPFWPSPASTSGVAPGFGTAPAVPAPTPAPGAQGGPPSGMQPINYQYMDVPSYWYPH